MNRVVIVGSSVAGVNCALSLRSAGFQGEVLLVDEETAAPYDKPPLSKELLSDTVPRENLSLLARPGLTGADLTLLQGRRAVGLDLENHALRLSDGDSVDYDRLVIATGARAKASPWRCRSGIHTLRTLDNALALRAEMVPGRRMIVIGAGFIGMEVAATSRALGLEVVVIDPQPAPMARVFDSETGDLFADLHRRYGVEMLLGAGIESIRQRGDGLQVRLTTGGLRAADVVLVCIGSVPNDGWLTGSGLVIDDGVVCNAYGMAAGRQDVFAIGDVARWTHPDSGVGLRVEHWTNAVEQATCVAYNLLHPDSMRQHDPVEYVWSDQYDWRIQVAGRVRASASSVRVDGPKTDQFAVLFSDDRGSLRGGLAVNWPRAMSSCRRVIRTGGVARDIEAQLQAN